MDVKDCQQVRLAEAKIPEFATTEEKIKITAWIYMREALILLKSLPRSIRLTDAKIKDQVADLILLINTDEKYLGDKS